MKQFCKKADILTLETYINLQNQKASHGLGLDVFQKWLINAQFEAVWNAKFAQHFCTCPALGIKPQTF